MGRLSIALAKLGPGHARGTKCSVFGSACCFRNSLGVFSLVNRLYLRVQSIGCRLFAFFFASRRLIISSLQMFIRIPGPARKKPRHQVWTFYCLLLFVGTSVTPADGEEPDALGVKGAPQKNRPNILFAISDDQSFPHASAYGCEWVDTPSFDRVAENGLLFNRCYTPNAKCAPSRSAILTGRYSWQLEEAANHWCFFPAKFKSYGEALSESGYRVGMTGKGWAPGIALDANGKRREMAGKNYSGLKTKPPTKAISSNDYAGNFREFLDATPDDAPFCFWFGATEPHRNYEFGTGVSVGGKKLDSVRDVPSYWPDNEVIRNDMLDYALEVEHFDMHLGRMLDELEKRGLLEQTLVVVTSDNGMPFPRVKGQSYEQSHHLPLAISWPQGIQRPGRVIEELVSFVDFAPTYLEVAGIDWSRSGMKPISGQSLVPIFRDEQSRPKRESLLFGKERHDIGRPEDVGYPVRGIIRGDFLLIHNYEGDRWPAGNPITGYLNTDGSPTKTEILNARRSGANLQWWKLAFGKRPKFELYNIANDTDCLRNLAFLDSYKEQRQELLEMMEMRLREQNDPRMEGRGEVFERYPYADARGRGFYERFLRDPKSVRAGWVRPTDFEKDGDEIERE